MPSVSIISDLHLGSPLCRAHDLLDFLERQTGELIVNGDALESLDLRGMTPLHWQILAELRRKNVVWIAGNHDGPAERMSSLLGIHAHREYRFQSGHVWVLVLHGDRFDSFVTRHPLLTAVGDGIYNAAQHVSTRLASRLKEKNKTFLHCAAQVRDGALRYAARKGCEVVCCGHSHRAEVTAGYANSGSWTESPCT